MNAAPDLPKLLSVEDLATYLDIPKNTIYVWRTYGLGPRGIKVGRHTRFRQSDVETWLDEQTRRAEKGT